ncbi:MAG: hypothetical protein H6918_12245 [Sphingomonadaceae bacterium]|nr:hypothetical protein [Novosphingobium sp.]MCP5397475.1 hypothetical protein [Sphingomonadaceae bacterium]
MTADLVLLFGFLVVMLAMSVWAAGRLPLASARSDQHEADAFLDSIGWRWFGLLLMPVNWLLLDTVVLLSEASVNAGSSGGVKAGQVLGGLAVTSTHAALVAILLRWTKR